MSPAIRRPLGRPWPSRTDRPRRSAVHRCCGCCVGWSLGWSHPVRDVRDSCPRCGAHQRHQRHHHHARNRDDADRCRPEPNIKHTEGPIGAAARRSRARGLGPPTTRRVWGCRRARECEALHMRAPRAGRARTACMARGVALQRGDEATRRRGDEATRRRGDDTTRRRQPMAQPSDQRARERPATRAANSRGDDNDASGCFTVKNAIRVLFAVSRRRGRNGDHICLRHLQKHKELRRGTRTSY